MLDARSSMPRKFRPAPKKQFKPRLPPGPHFPADHILHKVKGVLVRHPEGVTLRQLAREADIRWETATKYVDYLEGKETTIQVVGRAKLVRPKPKEEASEPAASGSN